MAGGSGNSDAGAFNLMDDKRLTTSISNLQSRLAVVTDLLDKCFENDLYADASPADRVKYDLFIAYALTSLFWAYLRTTGVDPRQHPLKNEVARIKSYMAKAKTVHDRHLRPKVNQAASKRFVRNALWSAPEDENIQNESRKRKRSQDDVE